MILKGDKNHTQANVKSSQIKDYCQCLSYELGVNGEKNSRETKNGHSTFHTGKPGNFNSLREVI